MAENLPNISGAIRKIPIRPPTSNHPVTEHPQDFVKLNVPSQAKNVFGHPYGMWQDDDELMILLNPMCNVETKIETSQSFIIPETVPSKQSSVVKMDIEECPIIPASKDVEHMEINHSPPATHSHNIQTQFQRIQDIISKNNTFRPENPSIIMITSKEELNHLVDEHCNAKSAVIVMEEAVPPVAVCGTSLTPVELSLEDFDHFQQHEQRQIINGICRPQDQLDKPAGFERKSNGNYGPADTTDRQENSPIIMVPPSLRQQSLINEHNYVQSAINVNEYINDFCEDLIFYSSNQTAVEQHLAPEPANHNAQHTNVMDEVVALEEICNNSNTSTLTADGSLNDLDQFSKQEQNQIIKGICVPQAHLDGLASLERNSDGIKGPEDTKDAQENPLIIKVPSSRQPNLIIEHKAQSAVTGSDKVVPLGETTNSNVTLSSSWNFDQLPQPKQNHRINGIWLPPTQLDKPSFSNEIAVDQSVVPELAKRINVQHNLIFKKGMRSSTALVENIDGIKGSSEDFNLIDEIMLTAEPEQEAAAELQSPDITDILDQYMVNNDFPSREELLESNKKLVADIKKLQEDIDGCLHKVMSEKLENPQNENSMYYENLKSLMDISKEFADLCAEDNINIGIE